MSRGNPTRELRRWPLVLILIFLGACSQEDGAKSEDGEDEEEIPPIPVEVQPTSRDDVYAVYSGTATLEADSEAQVIAKVGGEVIEILVEEGDQVRAGQILARLDGDRLRLEQQQARANLAKLERDYNRNVDLHDQGLVASGAFEGIKYDLDAQRAAYERATLELGYTKIRAGIDGVVSERFVKVGNTISVNDPTFHVTDLDPLIAYLHVPEREFKKLEAEQPAGIAVDAIPDVQFAGTIARISPVVDPDTGTFKVTVEVADDSGRLKPGMFGRINIVYDVHPNALLIPRSAILDEETDPGVFVVTDDIANRRAVQPGLGRGGDVEILDGLTGDEQIVVVGQAGLRDGAKVDVVGDTISLAVENGNDDDAEK